MKILVVKWQRDVCTSRGVPPSLTAMPMLGLSFVEHWLGLSAKIMVVARELFTQHSMLGVGVRYQREEDGCCGCMSTSAGLTRLSLFAGTGHMSSWRVGGTHRFADAHGQQNAASLGGDCTTCTPGCDVSALVP